MLSWEIILLIIGILIIVFLAFAMILTLILTKKADERSYEYYIEKSNETKTD